MAKYQYYITGDDQEQGFYATLAWSAQTFTPSIAHTITSVKLKLRRSTADTSGTMTVSITETDSGKPSGSALCSGTYDVTNPAITTDAGGEWVEITLGAGYALLADSVYAIIVKAGTDDPTKAMVWRRDSTDATYAGGERLQTLDEGDLWTASSSEDFMFEEWGEDALTVTTQAMTTISGTTATGNGNITNLGGSNPTAHGHCWAETADPTTSDSIVDNGAASATGAFTSALTGLTVGTGYYVRAFATNAQGTSYGVNVYFIGGAPSVGELRGVIAVVEERLHYLDAYGQERYIEGTVV